MQAASSPRLSAHPGPAWMRLFASDPDLVTAQTCLACRFSCMSVYIYTHIYTYIYIYIYIMRAVRRDNSGKSRTRSYFHEIFVWARKSLELSSPRLPPSPAVSPLSHPSLGKVHIHTANNWDTRRNVQVSLGYVSLGSRVSKTIPSRWDRLEYICICMYIYVYIYSLCVCDLSTWSKHVIWVHDLRMWLSCVRFTAVDRAAQRLLAAWKGDTKRKTPRTPAVCRTCATFLGILWWLGKPLYVFTCILCVCLCVQNFVYVKFPCIIVHQMGWERIVLITNTHSVNLILFHRLLSTDCYNELVESTKLYAHIYTYICAHVVHEDFKCVQHYIPEGSNEWQVRRIPREETETSVDWLRKGASCMCVCVCVSAFTFHILYQPSNLLAISL